MNPPLYGYNGISAFSSIISNKVSKTEYLLGLSGNYHNFYQYYPQTPIYNSIHNLKYVNSNNSIKLNEDFYKEEYALNKSLTVYKNKYYLPVSFVVNDNIKKWKTYNADPFKVQSDFVKLTSDQDNIFTQSKYISSDFESLKCKNINKNSSYYITKGKGNATALITIESVDDGNMYSYVNCENLSKIYYYFEHKTIEIDFKHEYSHIVDLGKLSKGDKVKIKLVFKTNAFNKTNLNICNYNINKDKFNKFYKTVSKDILRVDSYDDTHIKGNITVSKNGCLYSSIPYDDSWHVYIDGKEVDTYTIGDAFIGVDITKGTHVIEYKYILKGLNEGIIISCISWLLLFIYLFKYKKQSHKRLFFAFCNR